jgi:hypothetical protein
MLSPFASLKPGEKYWWPYVWSACRIGGDYPVLDCSAYGVTCEQLTAQRKGDKVRLTGRFGVFARLTAEIQFLDAQGRSCGFTVLPANLSPLKPLVLDQEVPAPSEAAEVRLVLRDRDGKELESLATSAVK